MVGAALGEANRTPLLATMKAVCAGWGRSAGLPGRDLVCDDLCTYIYCGGLFDLFSLEHRFYINEYLHMYMYIYIYMSAHISLYIYMDSYMYVQISTYEHNYICACMYIYTYILYVLCMYVLFHLNKE